MNQAGPSNRNVGRGIVLRTPRLVLTPLTRLDEGEHARASWRPADASRDTRAGELQWRDHGFGPWAIRELRGEGFLGSAELRFAGDGIEGIDPDEAEAGWWVAEEWRNRGIATEAMCVAIDDLWGRTDLDSSRPTSARARTTRRDVSRRSSVSRCVERAGRGRSGEPMTVYELRRVAWHRRGA